VQLNSKKVEEALRVQLAALEYKFMDTQAKLEESQEAYSALVESSNASLQSLQQTSALVEESLRLQLASAQNNASSHKNDKTPTSIDSSANAVNASLLAEMSAIEAQFSDGAATEDILKRIFDDAKSPSPTKRRALLHRKHHRKVATAAAVASPGASPGGPKLFSQPQQKEQAEKIVHFYKPDDLDTATNNNDVSTMTAGDDKNDSYVGSDSDSDTEVHDNDISRRNSADSDISFESVDSRGRRRFARAAAAADMSDLSDDGTSGPPGSPSHSGSGKVLARRTKALEANLESAFFKITLLTQRLREMMQSRDVLISAQRTVRQLLLGIALTPIEDGRYKQDSEVKILFNQIHSIVASFERMQESMARRDSRHNQLALNQPDRAAPLT
jgi:hypothetical protein